MCDRRGLGARLPGLLGDGGNDRLLAVHRVGATIRQRETLRRQRGRRTAVIGAQPGWFTLPRATLAPAWPYERASLFGRASLK